MYVKVFDSPPFNLGFFLEIFQTERLVRFVKSNPEKKAASNKRRKTKRLSAHK